LTPSSRTFLLDSDFKHVIVGNQGVTESVIKYGKTHGAMTDSDLRPDEIVDGNYRTDATPVSSPKNLTISKTASSTLTLAEQHKTIKADATSGTVTLTLPDAATVSFGYRIKRVNSGSNGVALATTSSQTIDGASTKTLGSQWAMVEVASDGANWQLVDQMGTVT